MALNTTIVHYHHFFLNQNLGKEADEIKDFQLIKNLTHANRYTLIFVP